MKEVLLVLLGALISCGTTMFLDWIKFNREERIHHKRKREEVYIEMQDFIVSCCAHWDYLKIGQVDIETRIKYNNLRTKAHIYGKKEIVDKFYNIANEMMTGKNIDGLNGSNDDLIKMIQEDLNIKE